MRCFKTRLLGRRLPNGKPQERLRFRALRGKTLAFKKRIAIVFAFCDLKSSLGARACVQVACVQKTRRFAFAFLNPLRKSSPEVPARRGDFWDQTCLQEAWGGQREKRQRDAREKARSDQGIVILLNWLTNCPMPLRQSLSLFYSFAVFGSSHGTWRQVGRFSFL